MEKAKSRLLAYRSFRTPLNSIERFSRAGYETVCVFPAHTLNSLGTPYSEWPPTWLWYDTYDFTPFDNMVAAITRAMPTARFLLMIDLNSPAWLEHNNWLSSNDTFMNLGKAIHNPVWREATEHYLTAFVTYAREKYGDRIAAYVLACGSTDEWYDYSRGSESSERRAAFRSYQTERGRPDPVDIPPESVREHYPHENFLRDPQGDRLALEYWRFCNESVADTILRFADITRAIVGDIAEIGCFYGYILEKCGKTLVSCGHLEYERVLDSENIDFLISPGTYVDRHIGGGSGFLTPRGTAAVRGKRLLHECDQRTHTYNSYLTPHINLRSPHWANEAETLAGLKRESALGLIKRTHLWWFDMWDDFYQGEAVMDVLARTAALWHKIPEEATDRCEVAMIVDPDSTYYVNQDHKRVNEMNLGTRNKLNRLGAPFEVYSLSDLSRLATLSQYKLLIFTSLFSLTEEKRRLLREYVLREGRSVLWLYGPGIITDGVLDPAACERISGVPYATPGLTRREMPGYTSYYLHEYAELTPAMLRSIAAEAGVHLYTEGEQPVYAEGDLLAVHSKEGGDTAITVDPAYREAEELYTGTRVRITGGRFTYPMKTPDTALFCLHK